MPSENSGTIRYDINDPADMAELIRTGLVWRGGPKTIRLAVEYLRSHPEAVNPMVPQQVLAVLQPAAPEPESPAEEAPEPVEEPIVEPSEPPVA